ncbi:flavin reductase [Robiginitalea sp. M366]|uniref:flavin reductase family protein n=1 Tax=Robiginitalea aestuariiviva TaxID=3036903 RepID=UPI00240D9734|nr:flavin reductase [Robiginitalea aestuariiviva]MDG1572146.1 flavin reductase [Robiginitalea aestuariiviva]
MEKHWNALELDALPGRYRATLINKVAGYKTAHLIGTRSPDGIENLGVFNSVVHLGANPPYLGFILRPTTVPRHTYENLKASGVYTLNGITAGIHRQAHMASGKFPPEVSEFEASSLTPWYLEGFEAPFVAESPIRIGMRFEEEHRICNDTRLIVGRVEHLLLPDAAVAEDGDLDLQALDAVAIGGLDSYYSGTLLGRYGYFRPGEPLEERLSP